MPIECTLLEGQPVALDRCPKCSTWPFTPFMRGQVQRSGRKWFIGPRRDYCALICSDCKEIVGHESPPGMRLRVDGKVRQHLGASSYQATKTMNDKLFTVLLW